MGWNNVKGLWKEKKHENVDYFKYYEENSYMAYSIKCYYEWHPFRIYNWWNLAKFTTWLGLISSLKGEKRSLIIF